jgi:hypothetical protein
LETPGEEGGLTEKKDKKKDKKDKKKKKKNKDKNEGEHSEDKREDRKEKKKEKSKTTQAGTQETQPSDDDDDISVINLSKRKGTGLVVNPRPKRLAAEKVTMLCLRDTYNLATRQARNLLKIRWMKLITKRRTARMNRSKSASKPHLKPANMTYAS